jgi:hypothetical protein
VKIATTTTILGLALAALLGWWLRWIAITVVCPRCLVRAVPVRAGRCGWCAACGYAIDLERSMLRPS